MLPLFYTNIRQLCTKHIRAPFTIHLLYSILFFWGSTIVLADESSAIEKQTISFEMSLHTQLLDVIQTPGATLTPFVSDGCSGGLSVGWRYMASKIDTVKAVHGALPPWESCCITHDRAYHNATSAEETNSISFTKRKEADRQLQTCVIETGKTRSAELLAEYDITIAELNTLYQAIGNLMYHAVRIGGMPCTGLPWRWGFGWPECR